MATDVAFKYLTIVVDRKTSKRVPQVRIMRRETSREAYLGMNSFSANYEPNSKFGNFNLGWQLVYENETLNFKLYKRQEETILLSSKNS